MSAADLRTHYETFHNEVQERLDQECPIQDAIGVVAIRHGVSQTTVQRAYLIIKNDNGSEDRTAEVLRQAIQENQVETGVVIDLAAARKRHRKRMVRL